ncbi:MAG: BolA family transcriptional regulator [Gammaproteobacteria bacterium]|nr:BolA family transcriptional regulator [Gammaproteobacteria bacterium]
MTMDRIESIRMKLIDNLDADSVEIRDDSHLHDGHAGAASGGGHYAVTIISDRFTGHSLLERHRMVYSALDDMMQKEIHALSIETYTREERT